MKPTVALFGSNRSRKNDVPLTLYYCVLMCCRTTVREIDGTTPTGHGSKPTITWIL
jgi:hypothetical protein